MKKTIIILLLFVSAVANGSTYYVSTTGNDSNPGTIASPWATWQYAFNKLSAGDVLYIRGGIYSPTGTLSGGVYSGVRMVSRNGSAGKEIQILAYSGEIPIMDGANITQNGEHYGIRIEYSSYIHIKGLTVRNVVEHGVKYPATPIGGGDVNHITLEQCTVTRSGNGFSFGGACDYIYYINCDAFDNGDTYGSDQQPGGFCNGFNGNLSVGMHQFYEGCRAWLNSDDGYDNMAGSGYITYKNCWAFDNGHVTWGSMVGDGDGFKLGFPSSLKNEGGSQRTLTNCLAFDNGLMGFDESADPGPVINMTLLNCTAYNNKASGFGFYSTSGSYSGIATLKNCIAYQNDLPPRWNENVKLRSNCVQDHNSWQNGLTVSGSDFASLNSAEAKRARGADGSLPSITYLHLASASKLVDAGISVNLPYNGKAPDLGAFETGSGSAVTVLVPVYTSSIVENATPALLVVTYDLDLNSLIIPAAASFKVLINSVARVVNSVAVSAKKVMLTLASPIKYGDIISLSYTKPATNTLQTTSGGEAATISSKSVLNNLSSSIKDGTSAAIKLSIVPNPVHKIVNIVLEYTSTFTQQDAALSQQFIRIMDKSGKLFIEKLIAKGVTTFQIPINLKPGIYIVRVISGTLNLASQNIMVY
jgi:uncharacterized repeat protein (TIGR02059 family)